MRVAVALLLGSVATGTLVGCGESVTGPTRVAGTPALIGQGVAPDIDGQRVVWGEFAFPIRKIVVLNLVSRDTTVVKAANATTDQPTAPFVIDDTRVAWSSFLKDEADTEPDSSGIVVVDLATGMTTEFGVASPRSLANPALSGEWLTFEVRMASAIDHSDIAAFNLRTEEWVTVADRPGNQLDPAISGTRVVYEDVSTSTGKADIFLFDLETRQTSQLAAHDSRQGDPAIDGDIVVWTDRRNGNADVFMLDVSTAEERPVAVGPASQGKPDVSGDRIVWMEERGGNRDIFLYAIGQDRTFRITDDAALQNPQATQELAISGRHIVWREANDEGLFQLFLFELPSNL